MKKLLISALLILALAFGVSACAPDDNGKNPVKDPADNVETGTGSGDEEGTDKPDEPEQPFNRLAEFATSYDAIATLETITYRISLGEDYFTIIQHYEEDNETGFYYSKGEGDAIVQNSLTLSNTVESKTVSVRGENKWSALFTNVFSAFDFESDQTEYVVPETLYDSVKQLNYQLNQLLAPALTPDSARFYFENGSVLYESVYGDMTLNAKFFTSADKITVAEQTETDKTAAINSRLTALKNSSYTLEVYENDVKAATVEAGDSAIRVFADGAEYGYVKTQSGYDVVKVQEDKTLLESTSSQDFSTLLPTFAFDASVLIEKDGGFVFHNAVNTKGIANAFKIVDFETIVSSAYFTVKISDEKLTVSSKTSGAVYRLEFAKVGTTTVDFGSYEAKKGWADEDPGLAEAIVAMFGTVDAIPYYNSSWYIDFGEGYIELCTDEDLVPEEQFEEIFEGYLALLEEKYERLTAEEINELDLYYYADDEESAYVFRIDDTHTIEVYEGYGYPYGVDIYVQEI